MRNSTLVRVVEQARAYGQLILEPDEAAEVARHVRKRPGSAVMVGPSQHAPIASLPVYIITPTEVRTPKES